MCTFVYVADIKRECEFNSASRGNLMWLFFFRPGEVVMYVGGNIYLEYSRSEGRILIKARASRALGRARGRAGFYGWFVRWILKKHFPKVGWRRWLHKVLWNKCVVVRVCRLKIQNNIGDTGEDWQTNNSRLK